MRRRLYWLAIAVLYIAPVLAGVWGATWAAVAGFAAVLFAFNLAMEHLPRPPLLALASAVVMVALALVLVGFGWALRALIELEAIRPWWPLGLLALAAVLVARLANPPRLAREIEAFLDEATGKLETMAEELEQLDAAEPGMALDAEAVERMAAALDALPAGAASEEVARIVLPLTDQAAPGALFDAALARATAGPCPRDLAALHWAAVNDEALRLCTGRGQLARAFAAFTAAGDHAALDRFAGAAIRLFHDDPQAWREMPESGEILRLARTVEPANPALGEELSGLGRAMIELERRAGA